VERLYEDRLLRVHPNSEVGAFFDDPKDGFYIDKVMWQPAVTLRNGTTKEFVSSLEVIFRSDDWPENWWKERLPLWKKIALQECVEYLTLSMSRHGFAFSPGDKTFATLGEVLNDYSVSQAYNLIWRAAKDAAAFYMRERVNIFHAANTVVGSIQLYAERARLNSWDIKPYGRNFDCPQSMVSQVLHNVVLKIGEGGFTSAPTMLNLPPKSPSMGVADMLSH
jgi:hypothetical protein